MAAKLDVRASSERRKVPALARRGTSNPPRETTATRRPDVGTPVPVLLVDDSRAFLDLTRRILGPGQPHFEVHAVGSGSEALAFLARRPPYESAPRPAFVILDFNLPDLDAPAVLERGREMLASTPVLVLTETPWGDDERLARAAGAVAYHGKPSRSRMLRDLIVAFWEEHVHAGEHPPR